MKARWWVAIFAVLLLFPGPASLGAQDLKKIKIGYPAISYNQVHIWVAKEAIYYIHHNQQETKKIAGKYMRTNDPDVLEATYTWFVRRVAKKPYPTLKGIQFLLDEISGKLPQAKSARPEQFVDLGLLQELEKEGFFSEMGKRYS